MAKAANWRFGDRRHADRELWQSLGETFADLAPFPGRLATSWRVGVACALVAGVAMMFHIPESAISCYLVIFLVKQDGAENMLVATAAVFAITLLVALMIPVLQSTIESTWVRILTMVVVSVVFIFLGAATRLGEGGSIVALIIAFILTLVSAVPINGVISTGLRFAWEMAVLPMFVIAGFNLFFGRWSLTLLREELHQRLLLAQQALHGPDPETGLALRRKLEQGNDEHDKRVMLVKLLHQTTRQKADRMSRDVSASYQLLYAISALPETALDKARERFSAMIAAMVQALEEGQPFAEFVEDDVPGDGEGTAQMAAIMQALRTITGTEPVIYEKGKNDSFVAPDFLSNPRYLQFALKTTLAAMLCYLFYSAINWQGIHTAMVTCYVAALGTTGDTIHKLGLRIGGCLVGAAIGLGSIIWLTPQMDSVGGLMGLVFAVGLLSGWIAAGSEKISYAGVQIGLAFTLTVLQDYGPATDLSTAGDRIIGILVGNFAVYLTSTFIWPTPVSVDIRNLLGKVKAGIAELAATPPQQRMQKIATVSENEKWLGNVRYLLYLVPFEPHSLRLHVREEEEYKRLIQMLAQTGRDVYFSAEPPALLAPPQAALTDGAL
ncbi:FUSC family protein [Aquamicrobium segne]|uniref:FUSC family protein n=1 Tax=Aquamicrobium segne TaxID=469547 RepID=A0ABW0H0T9_9HYPH